MPSCEKEEGQDAEAEDHIKNQVESIETILSLVHGKILSKKYEAFKETLIQSQSPILQEFLYIASSYPSLNSSLFASGYSSLCIKIQE